MKKHFNAVSILILAGIQFNEDTECYTQKQTGKPFWKTNFQYRSGILKILTLNIDQYKQEKDNKNISREQHISFWEISLLKYYPSIIYNTKII